MCGKVTLYSRRRETTWLAATMRRKSWHRHVRYALCERPVLRAHGGDISPSNYACLRPIAAVNVNYATHEPCQVIVCSKSGIRGTPWLRDNDAASLLGIRGVTISAGNDLYRPVAEIINHGNSDILRDD